MTGGAPGSPSQPVASASKSIHAPSRRSSPEFPGERRWMARPAGFEPATPGLEGRLYKPTRDGPRQSLLILRPILGVGSNCCPPQTATACHTCVTPQPFDCSSTGNRILGGRHV